MSQTNPLRVRRAITELQDDYRNGNKKPLEDLMRAWKGIKELPYNDPKSFFMLGGFHGEPFRGPGSTDGAYWGGYCNHGNVLFPTWHRVYMLKLEEALQSIPGCEDVMLPYWDETAQSTLDNGIPWALTNQTFELDGETIANPLRSFIFPVTITDMVNGDDSLYTKPAGYETVRYPLSGLVGTPGAQEQSAAHNQQYLQNPDEATALLNTNVKNWIINETITASDGTVIPAGIDELFKHCLSAPNYTVFSNTTSAKAWNQDKTKVTSPDQLVVALESPHNDIHLAVGGFDVPGQGDLSPIDGANGDMGENDTAGLDPIFYFHHCNIDRVFWLWQKQNGHTDQLDIIPGYHGTNSSDAQGPTPGFEPNTPLDLNSPLYPFTHSDGKTYTSMDCINIETQLGFTYSPGSLEEKPMKMRLSKANSTKLVHISGINRASINGSFVISAFANMGGERRFIGYHSVLSRWNPQFCANCQTHEEAGASFPLPGITDAALRSAPVTVDVEIQRHDQGQPLLKATRQPQYKVEIR